VSDEEQPPEAPGDSSTSFTPPEAPGEETAAGSPADAKSRTPLIAAIAIILIVAVAAGTYFLVFAKDKGPFAFSGEIASQGSCGGNPTGFSAKMLAPNGSVIAQGPFGQHNTSAGCTITFASNRSGNFDLFQAAKPPRQ
jgi:hypothetical protein